MNKTNKKYLMFSFFLTATLILWSGNALAVEGEEDAGPFFYELPEMVVNLQSTKRATRVLKIRLNLELDSEHDMEIVDKIKPRMLNEFQIYLRHLYADDINGRGIVTLKKELLARANYAAKPIKFKDVLFRGILVQ